ncbi:MAG: hypothetical protein M3406_06150, partial [Chloroflexota bacterium]|nr:hypothetical protein [Chloroflexota bacterium]
IVNYANGSITSPGDDVTANPTTLARTDLTTSHTYDSAGSRTSAADPRRAIEAARGISLGADDFVTRWTHDALNRQLTERTPATPGLASSQRTMTQIHDELGLARSATDFGDLQTATEFNRAGRALRTFERPDAGTAAVISIATYDTDGKVLTAKDRRQAADSALGMTTYAYDALGRQTSVTEADGTSAESLTTTGYDGLDRRTSLVVGGQGTTYAYDLGGRITATDDGFACTTEAFDYRDLPTTTTSGLAGGTCGSAADARTLSHNHDGLGRLTRSEVSAGADLGDRTVDDVLDAVSNRRSTATRVDGVTATTTFALNRLDQLTKEERPDGTDTKTTYDPAGNALDRCFWRTATIESCKPVGSSFTDPPEQHTSTGYDARNQRVSLTDAAAESTTTYAPDHNYAVAAVYRATTSGREHQALYTYDDRHRLTGITFQTCTANASHACTDTPVSSGSDTYAYDDSDSRTRVVESNGAASSDRRYCYDARNQLNLRNTGAACSSGANDEAWTYDDAGNRLTATSGGSTTNFAYDADGLLCDVDTETVSCTNGNVAHDTAGRIDAWNGWTLGYDAEARLVSACKSSTCTAGHDKLAFRYDGEGHRTAIVATSAAGVTTTTEFRYLGDAVVEEKVNGTVVREFVTNEGGGISKLIVPSGQPDAGTYLVNWNGHGDALNLLRVNADGTTTLANSYTYGTWGTPTAATHNGIGDLAFRYVYVGQFGVQWDNMLGLDLHYMRARHYSPALGRFLQPDPPRLELNQFAYAGSSPVTVIDPCGTEGICPQELNYCAAPWNWSGCAIAFAAQDSATRLTKQKFPTTHWMDGTKANAYKHCLWNAAMTYFLGSARAKGFGDRHEACVTKNRDYYMDLHNNAQGRILGGRLGWQWAPYEVASKACLYALSIRQLIWVR